MLKNFYIHGENMHPIYKTHIFPVLLVIICILFAPAVSDAKPKVIRYCNWSYLNGEKYEILGLDSMNGLSFTLSVLKVKKTGKKVYCIISAMPAIGIQVEWKTSGYLSVDGKKIKTITLRDFTDAVYTIPINKKIWDSLIGKKFEIAYGTIRYPFYADRENYAKICSVSNLAK